MSPEETELLDAHRAPSIESLGDSLTDPLFE